MGKRVSKKIFRWKILVSLAKDGNWKSQKKYKKINTCLSSNIKLIQLVLEREKKKRHETEEDRIQK